VNRLLALFVLCFALCLSPGMISAQTAATPVAPPKSAPVHHTVAHTGSDPALLHPATLKATAPPVYEVTFNTTKGDFVITVTRAWAPNGADRFYNLVKHGYFTNVSFYRVVADFIVQFGLSPDPKINAAWSSANIKDDPVKQSNKAGTITYAMGGPNTRNTQVFINFSDNGSQLDNIGFSPFGQVTSGMDVVKQLYGGYGEISDLGGSGPAQGRVGEGGKAYLDKNFPKLDSIKSATVTSPAPAAPAHKPAAKAPAKAPAKTPPPSSSAPQQ
jgi:peptidyl-prolyl cis-trans isomerase A (cyclophilin A)